MKLLKWKVERADVATYLGVLILIITLESHVLPRPLVFFLGPFVFLFLFYLLVPSISAERWRHLFFLSAVCSLLGYLLMRYVFTHFG